MKKINILIASLFLISFNLKLFGQEDSVTIQNSTEPIKQSDFRQKRKYKYLDNNFREEKTLIKLGSNPLEELHSINDFKKFLRDVNVVFSLEQKISPSLSIINDYGFSKGIDYSIEKYFSSNIGIRYYYSINKRIQKSLGANNFHGNYFSLKIDNWVKYGPPVERFNDGGLIYQTVGLDDWIFDPLINVSWGMQRRIGKYGFVDVGPYVHFNKKLFIVSVNLNIGFGLSFKK